MLHRQWSVLISVGCVFACSQVFAQAQDPDLPSERAGLGGEPLISRGNPGELLIDASGGNGVIEVADKGMNFPSREAAIDWAAANMNGIVETDETGRRIGAFGRLTVYGKLVYGDANTQTSVAVDDYMVAKLGGKSGVVIIDGQSYCLRENGCSENAVADVVYAVPKETSPCNGHGFCVEASSWKKELPVWFFPIYRTIGSDIEQTAGGFQVDHHFCWKLGVIPWSCTRKTGSNTMRLDNAYLFNTGGIDETDPNIASGKIFQSGIRDNTDAIDLRMWSLFVSIKSDKPVPRAGGTAEAQLSGVCGAGESRSRTSTQDFLSTVTAAGDSTGCGGN